MNAKKGFLSVSLFSSIFSTSLSASQQQCVDLLNFKNRTSQASGEAKAILSPSSSGSSFAILPFGDYGDFKIIKAPSSATERAIRGTLASLPTMNPEVKELFASYYRQKVLSPSFLLFSLRLTNGCVSTAHGRALKLKERLDEKRKLEIFSLFLGLKYTVEESERMIVSEEQEADRFHETLFELSKEFDEYHAQMRVSKGAKGKFSYSSIEDFSKVILSLHVSEQWTAVHFVESKLLAHAQKTGLKVESSPQQYFAAFRKAVKAGKIKNLFALGLMEETLEFITRPEAAAQTLDSKNDVMNPIVEAKDAQVKPEVSVSENDLTFSSGKTNQIVPKAKAHEKYSQLESLFASIRPFGFKDGAHGLYSVKFHDSKELETELPPGSLVLYSLIKNPELLHAKFRKVVEARMGNALELSHRDGHVARIDADLFSVYYGDFRFVTYVEKQEGTSPVRLHVLTLYSKSKAKSGGSKIEVGYYDKAYLRKRQILDGFNRN